MVVFGGSYGIGADIAELARGLGADVFTFSRSTHRTRTSSAARTSPRAAREVVAKTGRVDFVVNTAGVLPRGTAAGDQRGDRVRRHRDQLPGAGLHRPGVLRATCKETQGSLLLFTSSSYTRGRSGYSLYSSAKAATVNLTQALADEWAGDRVRVNCVNPERTATPMRTKAFGQEPAGHAARLRHRRPHLARRAALGADRAHHRRTQGRPAVLHARQRTARPPLAAEPCVLVGRTVRSGRPNRALWRTGHRCVLGRRAP